MNLTKTPYLVLFVLLGAVGVGTATTVGTAAAVGTITLEGNPIESLGILDMNNNKITNLGAPTASADLATKEYADQGTATDTLGLLSCSTNQVPKWSGTQWECSDL